MIAPIDRRFERSNPSPIALDEATLGSFLENYNVFNLSGIDPTEELGLKILREGIESHAPIVMLIQSSASRFSFKIGAALPLGAGLVDCPQGIIDIYLDGKPTRKQVRYDLGKRSLGATKLSEEVHSLLIDALCCATVTPLEE